MCELFGFSSQTKKDISEYLQEFFSHSSEHPNGWGIADLDGDSVRRFTEPVAAHDSRLLPDVLKENRYFCNMVAHIRKATIGNICELNCHPFVKKDATGRTWTLIHNGTIFSGTNLISYRTKQLGTTDSERILLYLIDLINEETKHNDAPLNEFERFKVVERVVSDLSYRNKLNLIIYDGKQTYVHVNMKDTLFSKADGDGIVISTTPLGEKSGWNAVELTRLLVYENGVLRYKGKNHHNEFFDTMSMVPEQYEYAI